MPNSYRNVQVKCIIYNVNTNQWVMAIKDDGEPIYTDNIDEAEQITGRGNAHAVTRELRLTTKIPHASIEVNEAKRQHTLNNFNPSNMKIKGEDQTPRQFVESLLPDHYLVRETITGHIECITAEGIYDHSEWVIFMDYVRTYFGTSLKQVYHHNITDHKNFTVYYDYYKMHNVTPMGTLQRLEEEK